MRLCENRNRSKCEPQRSLRTHSVLSRQSANPRGLGRVRDLLPYKAEKLFARHPLSTTFSESSRQDPLGLIRKPTSVFRPAVRPELSILNANYESGDWLNQIKLLRAAYTGFIVELHGLT